MSWADCKPGSRRNAAWRLCGLCGQQRCASMWPKSASRMPARASGWQVVRQNLAESLVLACAGGVTGTALSFAMVRGLIAVLPEDVAGHWLSVRPDATVLGFSLLVVAIT